MKLIIDIPDNVYIACNEYKDNTNIGILQRILYIAISNGIPLEKIKEEIQEEMEDYLMEVDYIRGVKDGLLFSAEIIDKYIKENKEK